MTRLPPIIGHRGAAGVAPENTLASIQRAHADGARWVEFDIRLSRDGVPILMHDDSLERTTNGSGAADDRDWRDLESLDAGGWFDPAFQGEPIPNLSQVCIVLSRLDLGANVEIKPGRGREEETGRAVAQALLRHWPHSLPAPLLSSFSKPALKAAIEAAPRYPRALLFEGLPPDWQSEADRLGAEGIHLSHRHLSADQISAVRAAGLAVRVYTVNKREEARRLLAAGVQSVFSDRPAVLLPLA